MTPLEWGALIQPQPDMVQRLNLVSGTNVGPTAEIGALARAIAMGGGARAARHALIKSFEHVSLYMTSAEGDLRLTLGPDTGPTWDLALDLIAAAATPSFQLRRCFNDGAWFSPALRSARNKFCGQRCRNRFNYEMREQRARFVCVDCGRIHDIDAFSGLSLEDEIVQPSDVHALEPLCVPCVLTHHTEWTSYVSMAERALADAQSPTLSPATADYVGSVHRLIHEALQRQTEPQSFKMIADYVSKRMPVRGRRPDLTILGHLLRSPARYKQVSNTLFCLAEKPPVESRPREVQA
jgi:hypothetical protein